MTARANLTCLVVLAALPFAAAKDKKQALPDSVLKAHTAVVVIEPEAGEPISNPTANRTAQENVERALSRWGRFQLVESAQNADLVIAVQKGHASGPAITNSPTDNRPITAQSDGGTTRVGVQQGRPPDLGRPFPGDSTQPQIGMQTGTAEDVFEVFQGGVLHPLDAAPVWRYKGKDVLSEPQVPAVEQFRKAITEAEKQHQPKP